MKRRAILKYVSLLTGAAVGAPLAGTLLSGCQPPSSGNSDVGRMQFFTPEEYALLTDLVDTILPKTESPSASEVGVAATIDHMVGVVYNEADRKRYREGFSTLSTYLQQQGFRELAPAERTDLLRKLEPVREEALHRAYLDLKQQTVAYYLTTEEIGTKFLNYLPIPGDYQPCISLAEAGGKAWAL